MLFLAFFFKKMGGHDPHKDTSTSYCCCTTTTSTSNNNNVCSSHRPLHAMSRPSQQRTKWRWGGGQPGKNLSPPCSDVGPLYNRLAQRRASRLSQKKARENKHRRASPAAGPRAPWRVPTGDSAAPVTRSRHPTLVGDPDRGTQRTVIVNGSYITNLFFLLLIM